MAQNGKTRNDLVRDLGFKYSTVRDWEKGITVPRMDKVEMLANYFHCSNSDLLEEKEKPTVKDDGLSENKRKLIEFAKSVPEDKAEMILQVMRTIVEAD
jgi:transcriptional regulator with XRE-family HTH domain